MFFVRKPNKKLCQGPVVLLILDGFGITENRIGNAVASAKMPFFKSAWNNYPHSLLKADGAAVGLPKGETGNSEAGHATIGAGRAVVSDKIRINNDIKRKRFDDNQAFVQAALHALRHNSTLHLMGMLTGYQSGHADFGHITALVEFAKRLHLPKVALHIFTDGRDTSPYHASKLMMDLEKRLGPNMRIATVSGRFYAMDRDRNWQRTALVYDAIVRGEGIVCDSPVNAVEHAYERGESDEFIIPTVIMKPGMKPTVVNDNDAIIFWNLRSDRARQMVKPFIQPNFEERNPKSFSRRRVCKGLFFSTMTEFGRQIDGAVPAFPHLSVSGGLVEALRSYSQAYIAESEKYAQVTYFLNGGFDLPRFHETRIRIPSIRTATFQKYPQMRAAQIANEVVKALKKGYHFICANFANADMIGHTGDYAACKKACAAMDAPIAHICKEALRAKGCVFITSDHGNAEQLYGSHGQRDTHHNANPVPFLAITPVKGLKLKNGTLADVAPTILDALCVGIPEEMKGRNLLK